MMGATVLSMKQVSYAYAGRSAALKQVDWEITAGQFHCLLGRSGCGKTTLLKLAAGLLQPSSGQVMLQGVAALQPGNSTGFVFQSPTLLAWRTVLDNVLLPIALHNKPRPQDIHLAMDLLARMGLAQHSADYPRQLSGGQQSRVAIARALITQPAVLLMDEPFAALDAITREELQDLLQAVCRAQKTSVFFVTHDISEAVYLADRVAVMAQGSICCDLAIDLARPRQQSLRYSPEFNRLCAELRQAMDAVTA